jgi:uncharacterized protein
MIRRLPLYGEAAAVAEHAPRKNDHNTDAEVHLFESSHGHHAFIVNGSQIFDVVPEFTGEISQASVATLLTQALSTHNRFVDACASPVEPPAIRSISLNVAQSCNLSCVYCYADSGKFGGSARMMKVDVARRTADLLIEESDPGAQLVLGFMGGEPMLNRNVLHDVTRYAAQQAKVAGKTISFSITTNGTLTSRSDVELFSSYPFTVQISLDGGKSLNDSLRPAKDGSGSYDRVVDALKLFSHFGRPKHLAARVTVTPKTGRLLPILDELLALGFDEVGFAPVLVSAAADYAFAPDDFSTFLDHMIECGRKALAESVAGRSYPFSNFTTAIEQLHKGAHQPYPCGAGAAYVSANAEGELFACHRLVDDQAFAMGSTVEGSDLTARTEHLKRSHVDLMEPCRSCWARYLCGGGCYHEVSRRGRIACDYIRGWLEFCLQAYVELTAAQPEAFIAQDGRLLTDREILGVF